MRAVMSALQQPGDLRKAGRPLGKQDVGSLVLPIAVIRLERAACAQTMLQDQPCIQRPAWVTAGLRGFPAHENG